MPGLHIDSDVNSNNGLTATFQADRGFLTFTTIDAGMWAPGTVNATVWYDQNDENGRNLGVTVELLESNNNLIKSAVTDANVVATITDVPTDHSLRLRFLALTSTQISPREAVTNRVIAIRTQAIAIRRPSRQIVVSRFSMTLMWG